MDYYIDRFKSYTDFIMFTNDIRQYKEYNDLLLTKREDYIKELEKFNYERDEIIQTLEQITYDLKIENQDKEDTINELKSSLEDKEERINELSLSLEQNKEYIEKLKKNTISYDEYEIQIEKITNSLIKLIKDKDSYIEELKDKLKDYEQLNTYLARLESSSKLKDETIGELTEQIQDLNIIVTQIRSRIETLQYDNQRLEESVAEREKIIDELRQEKFSDDRFIESKLQKLDIPYFGQAINKLDQYMDLPLEDFYKLILQVYHALILSNEKTIFRHNNLILSNIGVVEEKIRIGDIESDYLVQISDFEKSDFEDENLIFKHKSILFQSDLQTFLNQIKTRKDITRYIDRMLTLSVTECFYRTRYIIENIDKYLNISKDFNYLLQKYKKEFISFYTLYLNPSGNAMVTNKLLKLFDDYIRDRDRKKYISELRGLNVKQIEKSKLFTESREFILSHFDRVELDAGDRILDFNTEDIKYLDDLEKRFMSANVYGCNMDSKFVNMGGRNKIYDFKNIKSVGPFNLINVNYKLSLIDSETMNYILAELSGLLADGGMILFAEYDCDDSYEIYDEQKDMVELENDVINYVLLKTKRKSYVPSNINMMPSMYLQNRLEEYYGSVKSYKYVSFEDSFKSKILFECRK